MMGSGILGHVFLFSASELNPFAVPGAHDGYIADRGLTVSGGKVTQATDQTGNSNTLTEAVAGEGPDYVASWRNGRAALLGKSAGVVVGLLRGTQANGTRSQPFTRYTVGSQPAAGANTVLVCGNSVRSDTYIQSTLRPAMFVDGGSAISAASAPSSGVPFVRRDVFSGASSTSRVEPHGEAAITFSGTLASAAANGIGWMCLRGTAAGNWQGHGAFLLDVAGNLPLTNPNLDGQIMAWLRSYYDIVHT